MSNPIVQLGTYVSVRHLKPCSRCGDDCAWAKSTRTGKWYLCETLEFEIFTSLGHPSTVLYPTPWILHKCWKEAVYTYQPTVKKLEEKNMDRPIPETGFSRLMQEAENMSLEMLHLYYDSWEETLDHWKSIKFERQHELDKALIQIEEARRRMEAYQEAMQKKQGDTNHGNNE